MAARVEVEFDVFSGMPNPTWVLTDAEADSFVAQVSALPPTAPAKLSGNLGYRGFIVHVTLGPESWLVYVQNGAVDITKNATTVDARDEGRRLERWLLDTGKPHLDDELFELPGLG